MYSKLFLNKFWLLAQLVARLQCAPVQLAVCGSLLQRDLGTDFGVSFPSSSHMIALQLPILHCYYEFVIRKIPSPSSDFFCCYLFCLFVFKWFWIQIVMLNMKPGEVQTYLPPPPHKIVDYLNGNIIGHYVMKKAISVAIYNHFCNINFSR